jgi:hypothetical protein
MVQTSTKYGNGGATYPETGTMGNAVDTSRHATGDDQTR